ncbi:helix-turn-helix transcriptional regulator [Gemella sp. GH3]|uniref:helix-turn-helix domain-containing protein n=1 Tax=unclassified Gemella TaxID=2624949 RepID=UPI0015CFC4EB|nr:MULTISPECIES: helix-turn-helix transcriptional regulator [unclassified Gemella]MBF0714536.1 helix-turn-helix transcriptional regulator [Gemella sp. GH3.1]NYS51488.1 helix-turn-helix transcriptional regulator [Gemella sp. GH3]
MEQITLEAARVNAGLTMKEAGEKLNVHHQTISKYEKDSSKIPLNLLNAMSDLYKISKDRIYLGQKKQHSQ